jgi:hypothetical protein
VTVPPADLGEQPRPTLTGAILDDDNAVTIMLHCATPEMALAYQRWLLTRGAIAAIHEEFGLWNDSGRPAR